MRATICGETRKIENIYDKSFVDNFFASEKEVFLSIMGNNFLCESKITDSAALNYVNIVPERPVLQAMKNIILKEFEDCNKIFPYLGDYLLAHLFTNVTKKGKVLKYQKKDESKIIKSLKYDLNKNFARWLFNNSSLKRTICVEYANINQLAIEILDNLNLDFSYDYDFFHGIDCRNIVDYRFVIINGIIESVGEIHHLLHKANETKEPYVFFCFGMNDEVKNTIIKNNRAGRFRVFPVSIDSDDEISLNILNDIAALHGDSIVSSDLGQTISQEVRKELKIGKKISFYKNKISLVPCVSDKQINMHKKFLVNRLNEALYKGSVHTDPIKKRIKMFNCKTLNLFVPEGMMKDTDYTRELHYFLSLMMHLSTCLQSITIDNRRVYLPEVFIKIAESKSKSLKEKLKQIHVVVS